MCVLEFVTRVFNQLKIDERVVGFVFLSKFNIVNFLWRHARNKNEISRWPRTFLILLWRLGKRSSNWIKKHNTHFTVLPDSFIVEWIWNSAIVSLFDWSRKLRRARCQLSAITVNRFQPWWYKLSDYTRSIIFFFPYLYLCIFFEIHNLQMTTKISQYLRKAERYELKLQCEHSFINVIWVAKNSIKVYLIKSLSIQSKKWNVKFLIKRE